MTDFSINRNFNCVSKYSVQLIQSAMQIEKGKNTTHLPSRKYDELGKKSLCISEEM